MNENEKIDFATTTGAGRFISTGTGHLPTTKAMAIVTADGEVSIDWEAVSEHAARKGDHLNNAFAQALLAVRDGTYKPMRTGEAMK